jgi:DNA mismatch endonuclease, patch repair protein
MADTVSRETRSRIMRAIKSKNTGPEMAVRKSLHALGLRFRLHARLPGSPDLIFPKHSKALFVHGCFWHGHGCGNGKAPATNRGYWIPKLKRNRERDVTVAAQLEAAGWGVIIIWECELKKLDWVRLAAEIRRPK